MLKNRSLPDAWFRPGDWLAIGLALITVVTSYFYFWGGWSKAGLAEITISGKHWRHVQLFEDQNIEVPGPLGISHLEVKDGRIRFTQSPCTQKLCIQQGWLKHSGASATCLPNRVSVSILGDDPRYDTMNF